MRSADTLGDRLHAAALGALLGHQLGQWSERRWWRFAARGELETELGTGQLSDPAWLAGALRDPPAITTPGWAPTAYGDIVPHIAALGREYARSGGRLSPEDFGEFLLREKHWLRPQAVGRTCIELMSEGMNPRIAGLHAPSVLPSVWPAWAVGLAHAGYPDHAYEEAVLLTRAQGGGVAVILSGLLACMLARAAVPGASWAEARADALGAARRRDGAVAEALAGALDAGAASPVGELGRAVRALEPIRRISRFSLDWLPDFFAAVAVIEWWAAGGRRVEDAARALLEGCDTRFGAMVAFSVLAPLGGPGIFPDAWTRALGDLHASTIGSWAADTAGLLARRSARDARLAGEILPLAGPGVVEASPLCDRILAGLLAGAIGNVMGSPVEDRDYPWIVERYGVLDRILEPGRLDREDDSAMTKLWAETYIACGGRARVEDLAEMFRARLDRSGYYYDTQHAFDLLLAGLPPHACGHWNIVTGSSMMGCAPCGMYHAGDPASAAADALELAYHYQRGFDVHGAAILCAAVAEALGPRPTVQSVLDAAVAAAPAPPQQYFNRHRGRDAKAHLREALRLVEGCASVLDARAPLYEHFLEYNGQDPWEVVTYTLAVFKVARGDVWQCMIGGANIGRDSDTISNLSAVLGACMHGMAAVPDRLMGLFSEERLREYRGLARGLAELVKARCERVGVTRRRLGLVA